jgi:Fe-S-cluster containining protein
MSCGRPKRDLELVQIVDEALSDAAQKAGDWLVCRPGCTQCCVGAFAINQLDAARMRDGIHTLRQTDPARAEQVRRRAEAYVDRINNLFPGDIFTGLIDGDAESDGRFDSFANDEVCPALDPETGTCDLYQFRPMTCRVFGPPVRNEDRNLSVCELCFHGAGDEQIVACELHLDRSHLEDELIDELNGAGKTGNTIVAFALAK